MCSAGYSWIQLANGLTDDIRYHFSVALLWLAGIVLLVMTTTMPSFYQVPNELCNVISCLNVILDHYFVCVCLVG